MPFFNAAQRTSRTIGPGVHLGTMWGDNIMVSVVNLDANAKVPAHTHPHEQMGMVLEGFLTMTIGEETQVLTVGDVYLAPTNTEHSVAAGDVNTKVLDIFSPPREDYK